MFVRVYRPQEQREILVNVDHVWKIEVMYAKPGDNSLHVTTLQQGLKNPSAVRIYKVFAGSEQITLVGDDPNDPVVKVFEQIYKDAIKGNEPMGPGPE